MEMVRRKFARTVVLLCVVLVALAPGFAEDIKKIVPTGYVSDLAGTIAPETKARLEALCTELEQKAGAQMAIVTVHSLEGRNVDDYAVDLFKQLGVGGKKDDRGVLLLVSPDERKYRIEVGYGLEGVINDARAGDVGRSMVPFLKQGDYNNAIESAAWQLAKMIADDRGVTLSGNPPARVAQTRHDDSGGSGFPWIFVIILVLFFLFRGGGSGGGLWWLALLSGMGGGGGRGSGWSGGGFGGSSGGGGGGGGFGGFGGGGSGGGGASGGW